VWDLGVRGGPGTVAHLSDRDARFLADIQVILSSEETDDQRPNRYFVVTRTLKYHGYAINQIAIPRTPDRETLASLVDGAEGRLSPDHPGIQQWIAAGFVLGVESDDSRDQEIEAYVLVDFLRARDDIGSQLFDLIAREDLLSDPHVLSIYEGYGVQMNTQFVLRLRAIPQDLFAFVEHFHRRCDQAFLRAQTNTYIVASRITNHLYHTLLMPPLNEVDKNVRDVLSCRSFPLTSRPNSSTNQRKLRRLPFNPSLRSIAPSPRSNCPARWPPRRIYAASGGRLFAPSQQAIPQSCAMRTLISGRSSNPLCVIRRSRPCVRDIPIFGKPSVIALSRPQPRQKAPNG